MSDKEAFADWVKALGSMDSAKMNCQNPYFKSKYADMDAVKKATMPALVENNMGISQPIGVVDGVFGLITRVTHKSGVVVEQGFYPLPQNSKPQDLGSAITYGRRYSWAAICGVVSDEDDDGNGANKDNVNTEPPATQADPKDIKDIAQGMADGLKSFVESGTEAEFDKLTLSDDYKANMKRLHDEWKAGYDRIGQLMQQSREAIASRNNAFPGDVA